jgi:hypothetical protein
LDRFGKGFDAFNALPTKRKKVVIKLLEARTMSTQPNPKSSQKTKTKKIKNICEFLQNKFVF